MYRTGHKHSISDDINNRNYFGKFKFLIIMSLCSLILCEEKLKSLKREATPSWLISYSLQVNNKKRQIKYRFNIFEHNFHEHLNAYASIIAYVLQQCIFIGKKKTEKRFNQNIRRCMRNIFLYAKKVKTLLKCIKEKYI